MEQGQGVCGGGLRPGNHAEKPPAAKNKVVIKTQQPINSLLALLLFIPNPCPPTHPNMIACVLCFLVILAHLAALTDMWKLNFTVAARVAPDLIHAR